MGTNRPQSRNLTLLLCFFLAALSLRPLQAKAPVAEDLFRDGLIPSVHLQLSADAVSSLTRSPRKYVRANVREGMKTYTNVAVRLKGGPGSFRPLQDKPAFTLNFGKFAEGQTFHGLKKIHLNNSVQDSTFLHEKFSRELFEAAGVPVPRAGNAWVNFNDRELGMYVLLEGVNKQFLKRFFKDTSGNVYDGHSGSEVTMDLPVNSGDTPRDRSRLRALAAAAREPDPAERYAELQKALDLDRFYSFVAIELMLGHWDGYTMNRNNWRIYHDRDTDRMVFIPHGLDQVLGRSYPIYPPNSQALVVRAVMDIPEARKQYRARYAAIATNIFLPTLTSRIQEMGEKIEAVLAKHDPQQAEVHRQRLASLCNRIRARSAALQNLLSPPDPVKFDNAGATRLANWTSKIDLGEAQLNREQDSNGKPLLHILAKSDCTASWRTTCDLPPGEYRFEARIKTKDVAFRQGDDRSGAGLRIHAYRKGQKNSGTRDWTPISFGFQVQDDSQPVELICELRAVKGEIWYDLESLKLVRE